MTPGDYHRHKYSFVRVLDGNLGFSSAGRRDAALSRYSGHSRAVRTVDDLRGAGQIDFGPVREDSPNDQRRVLTFDHAERLEFRFKLLGLLELLDIHFHRVGLN